MSDVCLRRGAFQFLVVSRCVKCDQTMYQALSRMSIVAHTDRSLAILSDAILDKMDATTLAQLKTRVAKRLTVVLDGPSKYTMDGKVYGCRHVDSAVYVYVGSTCETCLSRYHQHSYQAQRDSTTLFHLYMMKHGGPEQFICEIVQYVPCKDFKELLKAEEGIIKDLKPICNVSHNDIQNRISVNTKEMPPRITYEDIPDVDTTLPSSGKVSSFARRCARKRAVKLILAHDTAGVAKNDKLLYDYLSKPGKHLAWLVSLLIHKGRSDSVSVLCDAQFPGCGKITVSRATSILRDTNDLASAIGFSHCYDQVTTVDTAKIIALQVELSPKIAEIRDRYALPQSPTDTYRGLFMGIQVIFLNLVGVKLINVRKSPVKRVGMKTSRFNDYRLFPVDPCMSMLLSDTIQA